MSVVFLNSLVLGTLKHSQPLSENSLTLRRQDCCPQIWKSIFLEHRLIRKLLGSSLPIVRNSVCRGKPLCAGQKVHRFFPLPLVMKYQLKPYLDYYLDYDQNLTSSILHQFYSHLPKLMDHYLPYNFFCFITLQRCASLSQMFISQILLSMPQFFSLFVCLI